MSRLCGVWDIKVLKKTHPSITNWELHKKRSDAHLCDVMVQSWEALPISEMGSYNPGKKELGHLIHFIAIIPVLAIVRTFGAMHCFKEASYLPICHILPHPHHSMLGDLARPLATWLGSTLHWGKGGYFLNQIGQTVPTFFSRIVACTWVQRLPFLCTACCLKTHSPGIFSVHFSWGVGDLGRGGGVSIEAKAAPETQVWPIFCV